MTQAQTAKRSSVLAWVGIFAIFGYFIYLILDWLFFGAGVPVLLLGVFVGVIYFVFGWLPDWSKRSGQTRLASQRGVKGLLFVIVGIVLGSYWIPKQFDFRVAWYWRVALGIAVAVFGLMTRRYP